MPEQHRAGQAKSKPAGPAAKKAWQALMNHEVTKLRLDLLQHLAALMEKNVKHAPFRSKLEAWRWEE